MIGRIATVLGALILLTGCPPPWHTHHAWISFRTRLPVNPDADGDSRSVEVRIYELRDDDRFLSASPAALARNDKEILGPDLVDRTSKTISPRRSDLETLVEIDQPEADVAFIGVLALYPGERAKEASWHAVVRAREVDSILFELTDRTLKLVPRP